MWMRNVYGPSVRSQRSSPVKPRLVFALASILTGVSGNSTKRPRALFLGCWYSPSLTVTSGLRKRVTTTLPLNTRCRVERNSFRSVYLRAGGCGGWRVAVAESSTPRLSGVHGKPGLRGLSPSHLHRHFGTKKACNNNLAVKHALPRRTEFIPFGVFAGGWRVAVAESSTPRLIGVHGKPELRGLSPSHLHR
jgi:hypothetical protein